MDQIKSVGVVRRWHEELNWGIINSYDSEGSLQKYFFHKKRVLESSAIPLIGDRVSFNPAPPRSKGDLPAAVDVEVIGNMVSHDS